MQPILLLHGAIGSQEQLHWLRPALSSAFTVHTPDFPGHGGQTFVPAPFSIRMFALSVLDYMQAQGMASSNFFGYSMGGYVAMYLARHYPEKVDKIITLATKFHWSPAIADKEAKQLNPGKIQQKIPQFAALLEHRHAPNDWKEVLARTRDMMQALGKQQVLNAEDYARISSNILLLLGDRDTMVTVAETLEVFSALPNAAMAMLPRSAHALEQVNKEALLFHIRQMSAW